MQLTVVGASGSISGPDSPASCYLVRAPAGDHQDEDRSYGVLLDLGPGSLGVLHRFLDPAALDAVLLSHLHPDHCLDLCGLYVAAVHSATAPWPAIEVYGPSGTAERIDRAYAPTPDAADGSGPGGHFRFRTWAAEQVVGPFAVSTVRVAHPVEAYAIRLREIATGATLVFSGDTGPCPALVELARGADLLLCEAAYLDGSDHAPGVHLTGREAGEHAAAAEVGRLVLTHIPPWHDPEAVLAAAQPAFAGPTELARTGSTWTVGPDGGPGRVTFGRTTTS